MFTEKIFRRLLNRITGSVISVNTSEHVASLTFDDGPDPKFTPKLLDVLESHNAKATFFMIGKFASKYPDLVADVAKRGHAIGNHSWDHLSFPLLNRLERIRQIRKCSRTLAPYGVRLFRPPFGHQNKASCLDAKLLGYRVIAWNIIVEDWLDNKSSLTSKRLSEQLRPGSIILLHDSLLHASKPEYYNREPTIDAVDHFLKDHSKNYKFLTVPALLKKGRSVIRPWFNPPDVEWLNNLRLVDGR